MARNILLEEENIRLAKTALENVERLQARLASGEKLLDSEIDELVVHLYTAISEVNRFLRRAGSNEWPDLIEKRYTKEIIKNKIKEGAERTALLNNYVLQHNPLRK